jgi:hypothetical protein
MPGPWVDHPGDPPGWCRTGSSLKLKATYQLNQLFLTRGRSRKPANGKSIAAPSGSVILDAGGFKLAVAVNQIRQVAVWGEEQPGCGGGARSMRDGEQANGKKVRFHQGVSAQVKMIIGPGVQQASQTCLGLGLA